MIIGQEVYDGSLIHSRFAYKFFREKVVPIGNIVAFIAPMKVETEFMVDLEDVINKDFIYSNKAVNFCFELPLANLWGGVAFQRLFNTMIGDILADTIKAPVEIEGDDIFVRKEFISGDIALPRGKASVSIVCERQGAVLGHTGINIVAGDKAPSFAYSTHMTDEQAHKFMNNCIAAFYQTAKDIFEVTTKVI